MTHGGYPHPRRGYLPSCRARQQGGGTSPSREKIPSPNPVCCRWPRAAATFPSRVNSPAGCRPRVKIGEKKKPPLRSAPTNAPVHQVAAASMHAYELIAVAAGMRASPSTLRSALAVASCMAPSPADDGGSRLARRSPLGRCWFPAGRQPPAGTLKRSRSLWEARPRRDDGDRGDSRAPAVASAIGAVDHA